MKYSIDDIKCAFFIGVGGVSMSSLASILLQKGRVVYGYDMKSQPSTIKLESEGAIIVYDIEAGIPSSVDTVVYTAAVNEDHPMMKKAKERALKIISRAELLGSIASSYKTSIGVAGTHGKSTTTGLISSICMHEDKDTAVLSGANLPFLNSNYKTGNGERIIYEACEYKNSYHSMIPNLKVVLNCEHDHVDFFPGINDVISSFHKYINDYSATSSKNISVVNFDCENCKKATKGVASKVYYYSIKSKTDFYAFDIDIKSGYGVFSIKLFDGKIIENVKIRLPGLHNVSNAVAASAAAYLSGVSVESIKTGLESFSGVSRRFEYLGDFSDAKLFDDYAHHPDEIEVTLKAARSLKPGRLICVFQPHTYSRTYALIENFAKALSLADEVYLCPIFPARETNISGVSSEDIAKYTEKIVFIGSFEEIALKLSTELHYGDYCITMGAGEAYKVANILLGK